MSACPHDKLVSIPSEDDPQTMALVCRLCHKVVDVFRTDDLGAEGDDLGDPSEG